jgi:hypothetical protein
VANLGASRLLGKRLRHINASSNGQLVVMPDTRPLGDIRVNVPPAYIDKVGPPCDEVFPDRHVCAPDTGHNGLGIAATVAAVAAVTGDWAGDFFVFLVFLVVPFFMTIFTLALTVARCLAFCIVPVDGCVRVVALNDVSVPGMALGDAACVVNIAAAFDAPRVERRVGSVNVTATPYGIMARHHSASLTVSCFDPCASQRTVAYSGRFNSQSMGWSSTKEAEVSATKVSASSP